MIPGIATVLVSATAFAWTVYALQRRRVARQEAFARAFGALAVAPLTAYLVGFPGGAAFFRSPRLSEAVAAYGLLCLGWVVGALLPFLYVTFRRRSQGG